MFAMEPSVKAKFNSYPEEIKPLLNLVRELISLAAIEYELGTIEETLKWGEPSYLTKGGSAVRVDWKPKFPNHYFVFFHCQTRLIETFREIYGNLFTYEGKRAIVLTISEEVPLQELKHCISLSLRYHKLKHLPLLGA